MPLRRSREADADIRLIYLYGEAEFGAVAADRYAAKLDRALSLIAENPRIARVREEISGRARAFPVGSHIIVYEIENDDDVIVLRIRHACEDWQRQD